MVVAPDLAALDSLQCVDAAGLCNLVLLVPRNQAYEQIRRWHPRLFVICLGADDVEGCQLLTMLAVDPETRRIPFLVLKAPDDLEDREVDEGRSSPFWLETWPALV